MKKLYFYLLLLGMATLVTSCIGTGGSSKEKEEKPDPVIPITEATINGPLKDYFEVVPKNYKIKRDGSRYTTNIEIKRIGEGMPAPWVEGTDMELISGHITFQLLDKDGDMLDECEIDISWHEDIIALGVDETCFVETYSYDLDYSTISSICSVKTSSTFKCDTPKEVEAEVDPTKTREDLHQTMEDTKEALELIGTAGKAMRSLYGL